MNSNKYHIDVTPEEDLLFRDNKNKTIKSPKNTMFGGIFWTVVGVHAVALGALATTSFAKSSAKNESVENKPVPTPTPVPVASKATPAPTSVASPTPSPTPPTNSKHAATTDKSGLVKTYTVKQGDTINSIAKRYKLRTDRLLKINNIKDSNKIVAGQTLKFF